MVQIQKSINIKGKVAIIGRPNVGKSTLFNALTGSNSAIIDNQPGVTRDRLEKVAHYSKDISAGGFFLIDTGGFETNDYNFQPFSENEVWKQSQIALKECDLIILVFDGKHGLHQFDRSLLNLVKLQKKPYLIVVNKVDGIEQRKFVWDFYSLGLSDDPIPVSAAHRRGLEDLLTAIHKTLKDTNLKLHSKKPGSVDIRVSIVGRPNAGKSSLLNSLLCKERSIVSDVAGTTRDSVDVEMRAHGKVFQVVDTAGVRRRTKINEKIEGQSASQSIKSIMASDVVLLVLDALEGMTDQDARLINLAISRYKPVLLIINKWDLLQNKTPKSTVDYKNDIFTNALRDLSYLPVIFTSCKTRKNINNVLPQVLTIFSQYQKKVSTSLLNKVMEEMVHRTPPKIIKKYSKRAKFYYAAQLTAMPPKIIIKSNVSKEIDPAYKRYMMRNFKSKLGFSDIPIKINFENKNEKPSAS